MDNFIKNHEGTARRNQVRPGSVSFVTRFNLKPLAAALMATAFLGACGGGGGGGTAQPDSTTGTPTTGGTTTPSTGGTTPTTGGTTPTTGGTTPTTGGTTTGQPAAVAGATMTMSCVDGASFQCSGNTVFRKDNGIGLTSSGVQAYAHSTSDLLVPNPTKTSATGMALDDGNGTAEIRVAKDATTGAISTAAVLLNNLGLLWDGKNERPPIIETFRTTQSRATLDATGKLAFGAVPDPSDIAFYDFATKGTSGTQVNYANNAYFPRAVASRCEGATTCPTVESTGISSTQGDWRAPTGSVPDSTAVARLHEDGDVHAGNGTPGAGGTVTILPGGSGVGVPFPGSKGYRQFSNWGFRYANLGSWTSQDTVQIAEWANLGDAEHNKNRRGFVAYGAVTDPAAVPTSGSATYTGIAYGWYGRGAQEEPPMFSGPVSVTVNFATRQAVITVSNTVDGANAVVPGSFSATTLMGAAGTNVSNYMTSPLTSGGLTGGVSARLFGPVATSEAGAGPEEIAGTFRMSGTGGVAILGGFVGRKR